jgi:hypothetical protein
VQQKTVFGLIALGFFIGVIMPPIYSVTEPFVKITMDDSQTTDPIQILDSAGSTVFNINATGFIESDLNGTCIEGDVMTYDASTNAFDCEVATSHFPMGEISFFDTTGTNQVISAQSNGTSNLVEVVVTTTLNTDSVDFDMPENGVLRYTGTLTKDFHIALTISTSSTTVNETFVYAVCIDGSTDHLGDARIINKIANSGDTVSSAMHLFVPLTTNQEISLCMGNLGGTDDGVVKTMNIFAMGM